MRTTVVNSLEKQLTDLKDDNGYITLSLAGLFGSSFVIDTMALVKSESHWWKKINGINLSGIDGIVTLHSWVKIRNCTKEKSPEIQQRLVEEKAYIAILQARQDRLSSQR